MCHCHMELQISVMIQADIDLQLSALVYMEAQKVLISLHETML